MVSIVCSSLTVSLYAMTPGRNSMISHLPLLLVDHCFQLPNHTTAARLFALEP